MTFSDDLESLDAAVHVALVVAVVHVILGDDIVVVAVVHDTLVDV